MMDDFANDTWYQTYKDKGPQFHLISSMVVIYIIGIMGTVFNSSLIYITVKSRNLRGTYNYLLALIALSDVLYQMGHIVAIVVLTAGINFIPLVSCFHLMTIPLIGLFGSMIFMVLLSLDRLLSVVFPIWHMHLNAIFYVMINIAIGLCVITYIAYDTYGVILQTPNKPVNCRLGDCVTRIAFTCTLICNALTVFCYLCIWIVLKLKSATSSVKSTRKIFKSLAILVGLVVFGWMSNATLKLLILPAFKFNGLQLWYLSQCGAILTNFASAVNVPVLYFFSQDYRIIISNELLHLSRVIHISRTEPNNG